MLGRTHPDRGHVQLDEDRDIVLGAAELGRDHWGKFEQLSPGSAGMKRYVPGGLDKGR